MRRSMIAYLIFGTGLLTLYGVGGYSHWWRALDVTSGGSGGGHSTWGGGGGGVHGGK